MALGAAGLVSYLGFVGLKPSESKAEDQSLFAAWPEAGGEVGRWVAGKLLMWWRYGGMAKFGKTRDHLDPQGLEASTWLE